MANSIPARPGLKSGGSNPLELFLDLFGREVLAKYDERVLMKDKHRQETLTSGRSLKFPIMGDAAGGYHTPGTEILGGQVAFDERILSADDKYVSSAFLADIDEVMSHFGVREGYVEKITNTLVKHYDGNVMRAIIKAARDAGKLSDGGGSTVVDAALLTNVTKLFDAFSQAKEAMDSKNVDVDSKAVYGLVKTAQFYALKRSEKNVNRDYNPRADVTNNSITTIDGVTILKTNLPVFGVNDTANTDLPARYRANYAGTAGIVWTPDAVGTVQVQGVEVQHKEQIEKQGHLIIGRMMVGTDVLRATDAVELRTAALA